MKYQVLIRFLLAIGFFTLAPFLHKFPLLVTIDSAIGIYLIITGASKLMRPGEHKKKDQ